MKWTSLTLAALGGVATACVVDLENHVTCPSKTISNVVATFDDRPNAQVLGEYRHLNFNNVTVEHQGSGTHFRGISPHSKPHYGIAYPANTNSGGAILSLQDTKTTSFDFYSVYAGCLSPSNTKSGYEALACNISIDCNTYLSFEGHLGPQIFEYVPSKPFGAELMLMQTSEYLFCQEVVIEVSRQTPVDAVVVIDDVSYTIREGECIPGSPGDSGPKCAN